MAWKSTDGGKTLHRASAARRAATTTTASGSTRRTRDVILIAADQGAIITVNGGETWSSWYNQPTAQFYHVSTDNAFPYRVCGGQQESGSACVASRGDDGQITFRDWHPVAVEEYGYVAADPLDPDIVYGGKLTRFDRRTGQVQNIAPQRAARPSDYRVLRTAPVLFSPSTRSTLYFASNVVWKTTDGGQQLDGDQPRPHARRLGRRRRTSACTAGREAAKADAARRRSTRSRRRRSDADRIWAGTDDGLIHVTRDGGKTLDGRHAAGCATGPGARSRCSTPRTSTRGTAYAAINTLPPRRPAAAHLPHARRRQDLDGDHRRHPGRRRS